MSRKLRDRPDYRVICCRFEEEEELRSKGRDEEELCEERDYAMRYRISSF